MAAKTSSLSLSSRSSLPLNRSLPHRFHQTSLNLPFINDPLSPRLVSVRAQSGSERAPSVDGFESGSRPKSMAHSDCTEASSSSSAIDFLSLCHRLKTTKRKGWINHGIKGPESIADHMYRMSLMALIVGDLPGVNRERCIKMTIVHDIAEAIVGDITPSDGVPKEEKSRREQAALNEMCEVLGGGLRAEEIKELWAEYENNSSVEANLVKDFDKVEMILQALEYEMDSTQPFYDINGSPYGLGLFGLGRQWPMVRLFFPCGSQLLGMMHLDGEDPQFCCLTLEIFLLGIDQII